MFVVITLDASKDFVGKIKKIESAWSSPFVLFSAALVFDGTTNPVHPNTIGSIDPQCKVGDVVQDAFHSAKMLCDQYYLRSPDLVLQEMNHKKESDPISIVYVPSHLYHMLFELFKNAMRATIETHESSNNLPPIKVMVSLGGEDMSIK
ncbi:[Pyruvate dehydrogenase (acetyl-transferring)] kinase isozyme 2, partial [Ilyodon furcidens]